MNCGGSVHRPTVCLYETLGVDKSANEKDIKNAYRTQALRLHPDKNTGKEKESKLLFQEVSHAYSVLSDPAERRWYDEHRDEILHGGIDGDGGGGEVKLYQYRAGNAFHGFGDDPTSFYYVYDKAFREVFDTEATKHNSEPPPFGSMDTPFNEVLKFYNWWSNFSSRLTFSWEDDYNYSTAPNRRVRRAMEKEKYRLRSDARKSYDSEIQSLLTFVKRRDKRIIMEKVRVEQQRKIVEAQQREASIAKAEKLKERKALWMEQKLAEEELEWETGEGLPIRLADIDIVHDDSQANQERILYCCDICRKDFKSEKQYEQHSKSKIHKKKLVQFEASLALEAVNEGDVVKEEVASSEDDDDIGSSTTTSNSDEKVFISKQEEETMGLELGKNGLREGSLGFSSKKEGMRKDEMSVDLDSTNANEDITLTPSLTIPTMEKEENTVASFASSSSRESSDSDDDFFFVAALKKNGRGHSFSSSESDESLEEEVIKQKLQKEEEVVVEPSSKQDVGIRDEGFANVAPEEGKRKKNRRRNKNQSTGERVSASAGCCGSSVSCLVCGERFPSRSKLFVHVKSSGHAAAKK